MNYQEVLAQLNDAPKHWLITGVAGFIGSNSVSSGVKLTVCLFSLRFRKLRDPSLMIGCLIALLSSVVCFLSGLFGSVVFP